MKKIMKKVTLSKPIKILIALMILCFLGLLMTIEIQAFQRLKEISNWPATSGIVTHIDYERSSVSRQTSSSLLVSYRYSVDGKEYSDTNGSYSPTLSKNEILNRYAKGKKIQLLYNPNSHGDSALTKDGIEWTKGVLGVTSLLSLFSIIYIVFLIIYIKKSNKENATNGVPPSQI